MLLITNAVILHTWGVLNKKLEHHVIGIYSKDFGAEINWKINMRKVPFTLNIKHIIISFQQPNKKGRIPLSGGFFFFFKALVKLNERRK